MRTMKIIAAVSFFLVGCSGCGETVDVATDAIADEAVDQAECVPDARRCLANTAQLCTTSGTWMSAPAPCPVACDSGACVQ